MALHAVTRLPYLCLPEGCFAAKRQRSRLASLDRLAVDEHRHLAGDQPHAYALGASQLEEDGAEGGGALAGALGQPAHKAELRRRQELQYGRGKKGSIKCGLPVLKSHALWAALRRRQAQRCMGGAHVDRLAGLAGLAGNQSVEAPHRRCLPACTGWGRTRRVSDRCATTPRSAPQRCVAEQGQALACAASTHH